MFNKKLLSILLFPVLSFTMIKVPTTSLNTTAAAQSSKVAHYLTSYKSTPKETIANMPQVTLSQEQIQRLANDIAKDLNKADTSLQNKPKALIYPIGQPIKKIGFSYAGLFRPTKVTLSPARPSVNEPFTKDDAKKILGIEAQYPNKAQILNAYKSKAKIYHPDLGGTHQDFLNLQKAKNILDRDTETNIPEYTYNEKSQDYSKKQTENSEDMRYNIFVGQVPQDILNQYGLSKSNLKKASFHEGSFVYEKEFTDTDGFKKIKTIVFEWPNSQPLGNWKYFKNANNVNINIDLANNSEAYAYAVCLLINSNYCDELLTSLNSLYQEMQNWHTDETKDKLLKILREINLILTNLKNPYTSDTEKRTNGTYKVYTPYDYAYMLLGGKDLKNIKFVQLKDPSLNSYFRYITPVRS